MKNRVTLHKGMGELVLSRLRDFADMPAQGYVAGQAVSSAVSELFGDGRAVKYNDVDVFRPVTVEEDAEYTRLAQESLRRAEAENRDCAPLTNLCTFRTSQAQVNQYGQLVFATENKYTVRSTSRNGLLNEVACASLTKDPLSFLQTFDLNAVQVGVDLSTKELFWTPEFAHFLSSRQLEIVMLHTPFHSLVRYFKKRQELEGIYGNDERTIELIGAAFHKAERLRQERKAKSIDAPGLRWRFGQMYKEKLDAVADQILPHFEVVPLTETKAEIYLLKPRFDVQEDLLTAPGPIAQTMPRYSRALREKHRPGMQSRLDYMASEPKYCFTRTLWLTGRDDYLACNVTAAELKRMDRVLRKHPLLGPKIGSLPTLSEQWAAMKLLMEEASQRGGWVYGAVETSENLVFTREALIPVLDERAELLRQKLKKKGVRTLTVQDYTFTELVTGMGLSNEGEDLHHCIAGYAEGVKEGSSCIISVRKGDSAQDWLTLDMRLGCDGTWSRSQLRGLQNRVPTSREATIAREYEEQFRFMKVFGSSVGLWLFAHPKLRQKVQATFGVVSPLSVILTSAPAARKRFLSSQWHSWLHQLAKRLFGTTYISRQNGFFVPTNIGFWTHGLTCLALNKVINPKTPSLVSQKLAASNGALGLDYTDDIPF
jgi:hypothetical protein